MSHAAALIALDATTLANALRAGIYRLLQQTEDLNCINVFPVPDGDTGTNLAMTFSAVLASLDREPAGTHAGTLIVRAADSALDGARGNSGAIIAQFLLGFADAAGALEQLSAADLARAFVSGARYAREAVAQPREGTVLSVIARSAQEFERSLAAGAHDFRELPHGALPSVRELRLAVILTNFADGRIGAGGVILCRRRNVDAFARFVARRLVKRSARERAARASAATRSDPVRYRLVVGHAGNSSAAARLLEQINEQLPQAAVESASITTLGTALGVHVPWNARRRCADPMTPISLARLHLSIRSRGRLANRE